MKIAHQIYLNIWKDNSFQCNEKCWPVNQIRSSFDVNICDMQGVVKFSVHISQKPEVRTVSRVNYPTVKPDFCGGQCLLRSGCILPTEHERRPFQGPIIMRLSCSCHTLCKIFCPCTGILWCHLSILLLLCLMSTLLRTDQCLLVPRYHWQLVWNTIRSGSISIP